MPITEDKIVKIVDTTTHSRGASVEQVGGQGALIVKNVGLPVPNGYDYIGVEYDGMSEIYTYKTGGSSGTVLRVVTVVYTDASKQSLSSVAYSDV